MRRASDRRLRELADATERAEAERVWTLITPADDFTDYEPITCFEMMMHFAIPLDDGRYMMPRALIPPSAPPAYLPTRARALR